jgi:hypothetical protein
LLTEPPATLSYAPGHGPVSRWAAWAEDIDSASSVSCDLCYWESDVGDEVGGVGSPRV